MFIFTTGLMQLVLPVPEMRELIIQTNRKHLMNPVMNRLVQHLQFVMFLQATTALN